MAPTLVRVYNVPSDMSRQQLDEQVDQLTTTTTTTTGRHVDTNIDPVNRAATLTYDGPVDLQKRTFVFGGHTLAVMFEIIECMTVTIHSDWRDELRDCKLSNVLKPGVTTLTTGEGLQLKGDKESVLESVRCLETFVVEKLTNKQRTTVDQVIWEFIKFSDPGSNWETKLVASATADNDGSVVLTGNSDDVRKLNEKCGAGRLSRIVVKRQRQIPAGFTFETFKSELERLSSNDVLVRPSVDPGYCELIGKRSDIDRLISAVDAPSSANSSSPPPPPAAAAATPAVIFSIPAVSSPAQLYFPMQLKPDPATQQLQAAKPVVPKVAFDAPQTKYVSAPLFVPTAAAQVPPVQLSPRGAGRHSVDIYKMAHRNPPSPAKLATANPQLVVPVSHLALDTRPVPKTARPPPTIAFKPVATSNSNNNNNNNNLEMTTPKSGLKIGIRSGDILQSRCEVIISPCSRTLSRSNGLAKHLATAAGPALVKECDAFLARNPQGLQVTGFLNTTAGNLPPPTRRIIHCCGLGQRDNRTECTRLLAKTFLNCFVHANDQLHAASVAVPAIGTGAAGLPGEVAAEAAFTAIAQLDTHLSQQPAPSTVYLKYILFIDMNKDATKCLVDKFLQQLDPLSQVVCKQGNPAVSSNSSNDKSASLDRSASGQVQDNENRRSNLQHCARNEGYRIQEVPRDGDCALHSIVDQFKQHGFHQYDTLTLRAQAASYLQTVGLDASFLEQNQDGSAAVYLQRQATRGTWCDEPMLRAVAEVTNAEIRILHDNGHWTELRPQTTPSRSRTRLTIGLMGQHYVSLRSRKSFVGDDRHIAYPRPDGVGNRTRDPSTASDAAVAPPGRMYRSRSSGAINLGRQMTLFEDPADCSFDASQSPQRYFHQRYDRRAETASRRPNPSGFPPSAAHFAGRDSAV